MEVENSPHLETKHIFQDPIFHWTMIIGGRVGRIFCSKADLGWNTQWPMRLRLAIPQWSKILRWGPPLKKMRLSSPSFQGVLNTSGWWSVYELAVFFKLLNILWVNLSSELLHKLSPNPGPRQTNPTHQPNQPTDTQPTNSHINKVSPGNSLPSLCRTQNSSQKFPIPRKLSSWVSNQRMGRFCETPPSPGGLPSNGWWVPKTQFNQRGLFTLRIPGWTL